MSYVDFKKWPCRVEFRGQEPSYLPSHGLQSYIMSPIICTLIVYSAIHTHTVFMQRFVSRPLESTGRHGRFFNSTGRQGTFLKSTGDMGILGTNDMALS